MKVIINMVRKGIKEMEDKLISLTARKECKRAVISCIVFVYTQQGREREGKGKGKGKEREGKGKGKRMEREWKGKGKENEGKGRKMIG